MASRGGTRPVGSDGNDFTHRETVADHYKVSATNKSRLKLMVFVHFLMALLMLARLSTSLFVTFGYRPPRQLQNMQFPVATMWERAWLFSIMPAIFGIFAIRKNNVLLMQQFLLGHIIFGLGPVLYACYDLYDEFVAYISSKEVGPMFQGFPLIVLWAMFLTIAFQLHLFGIHFSYQLLKSWRVSRERYKRK